jgi:PAS domain-containing protein
MDITNLAPLDNAEAGVWTRVELYGKKQDFELNILGNDSDAIQKHIRAEMKRVRLNAGKEKLDDEIIDSAFDSGNEGILVRIAGIRGLQFDRKHKEILGYEPVTLEDKELKDDKESYQLLIEKIPAIKDFVLRVSGDRTVFLSKPSGD